MNRRFLIASLFLGVLVACAPSSRTNPLPASVVRTLTFSEVQVVTTGAAFESVRAADYSSRLSPDLEAALRREFSDRVGGGSTQMVVEVSRLNLAGGTGTAFGRDVSRLIGTVRVVEADGTLLATYPVQVTAGQAAETRTGAIFGAAVNSAGGYYRELLAAFAAQARDQILGQGLPGSDTLRRISR